MFGFWKARRARRAAVTAIGPFMDQTRRRFGKIPDWAWSDAYVIGFISTLITLFAERDAGEMGASELASVQIGAWSDITGIEGVLIGEDICFLSTAEDELFELGGRNAVSFFELHGTGSSGDPYDESNLLATPDCADGDFKSDLWIRYFDFYLGHMSTAGAFCH
jgi:hypothetical protein